MMLFLVKSRKRLVYNVALIASFVNFLSPTVCYTQGAEDPSLSAMLNFASKDQVDQGPSYTVNFNNVPVIEVIRFVSKVTNLNFVFNQEEIQFNVSIISEEPISVKNIISALIQVLRINGMNLLEQDNNLIITKGSDVNQIPTIVSGDIPNSDKTQSPLVTRVFRIKNANVTSLANIIKPLISKVALVEVSTETRQLIVTDITTNVDKIGSLLSSLDAPHTPLEIDSYEVKNVQITDVISLTTQLLSPFTEGNPLILVPQNETSTIFIVSTPYLIERAIAVMEDIDVKPRLKPKEELPKLAPTQAVYVYNIANRNPQEILSILQQVAKQLSESDPNGSMLLIQSLKSAKYISDTNSILFVTDATTWTKVSEILSSVDTHITAETSNLFIYQVKNMVGSSLLEALKQAVESSNDQDLFETIKQAKWIKESNTLVFNGSQTTIKRIQNILPTIDVSQTAEAVDLKNNFMIYTPKYKSGKEIQSALKETASNLKNSGLTNQSLISTLETARWVPTNDNIIFTGDNTSLQKVKEILTSIDTPSSVAEAEAKNTFLIYTPKYRTGKEIQSALNETTSSLKNGGLTNPVLINTLDSARWVPANNHFVFTGDAASLQKVEEILSTIDVPRSATATNVVYVYTIKNATSSTILESIKNMADTVQDPQLSDALKGGKWIPETNSIVFNAPQPIVDKIQSILPTLDVPPGKKDIAKSNFLIYSPKYQSGAALKKAILEMSSTLKTSGLSNPQLITALDSINWIPSSNSLVFTGDADSLKKVQEIISNIDIQAANSEKMSSFLYKPAHSTQKSLTESLNKFSANLDVAIPEEKSLKETILSAQWLPENNSVLFRGTDSSLARLKEILTSLDTEQVTQAPESKGFYLYKLKYTQGNVIVENLKSLSQMLETTDPSFKNISKTIDELKWVKENNTILITGTTTQIDQVKALIDDFDIPTTSGSPITPKSEFFIYKPTNQTPQDIQKSLQTLSKDLEQSGLVDQDLIHTINSSKLIPASGSLLFTGTTQSLEKLKPLLQNVDSVSDFSGKVQEVGESTFLVYKIRQADPTTLISSMKKFALNLGEINSQDKEIVDVINSCKYIKDTNSILFTGSPRALKQVETIAEKFDLVSEPKVREESSYVVYNPKFQKGQELITILDEFMNNLKSSGVSDPALYDTITNLKYIDKTNSLIITGPNSAIDKVQQLLVKFDVAGKQSLEPSISAIDTTNFLIYKLQYHKGAEILKALKDISSSLEKSPSENNRNLLSVIGSLQWIEVTNSLIASGESDILSKLKELIQSVDVPLRQVFIEVLVVETNLFNSQNFGLQWGSQLQYLNKTVGAMGNFPLPPGTTSTIGDSALNATPLIPSNIQNTTASNPPVQGSGSNNGIPFTSGFDLGVIGDIIMHKGKSFLSLGSLVNALQVDRDSTVVMNPKIITQDGHTSTIFVGQNIPFTGSFVSNTGSNATVQTSNIEYRDVGVNLTITPTLGTNNVITMQITQDISEQIPSTTTVQGSAVTGIQTSHTSMNTRVHVPDNHFLVLSGMIQNSKTNFRSGIPCLGGLPVVGALFAQNDRAASKTNVIIFVRPIIIDSFEDFDRITEEEEAMYKQNATLQILKEEFDDATEMIKALSNE